MKPLNLRKRALKGLTDYYIRRKTLVNYDQFIRLRFGKKNNYYYCGFYQTPSPALPDRCLGYFESRWLRTQGSIPLKNKDLSYVFGVLVAQKMVSVLNQKVILDLGRRKKINYDYFLKGFTSLVDLKHSRDLEPIQVSYNSGNFEWYKKKTYKA